MGIQEWFNKAAGSHFEEPETGDILTLVDVRYVGSELYFGLLPVGGAVKYVNIDRYDELIPVS